MGKVVKWTEEKITKLKEIYSHSTREELCEFFEIDLSSYSTIKWQVEKLKLKKDLWWKEEEIKILREYYPSIGLGVIKMLKGRTEKSVKKKAHELSIKIKEDIIFDIRNKNLQGRLDCNIVDNPNFNNDKGIRYACRNKLNPWRKRIIKMQKECQLTKSTTDLIVHHIRPFREIYYEVLNEFEADGFIVHNDLKECAKINGKEKLAEMLSEVAKRHKISDGILISKEVHDKFHNIYGTRNNTAEQFYKFAIEEYGVDVKSC